MGFTASKPASSFEPPPSGVHIARCYRLIDFGTQQKTYQGKPAGEARKVMATWELLGEDRMPDGKPFTMSKSWFLSLHQKAALRKDLESWRGKPFTPEEEACFDVARLLGAYCQINVGMKTGKDGNDWAEIMSIMPLAKGMPKPDPVNKNVLFDADKPDMAIFETFSDRMKGIIGESREWRARKAGGNPSTTATGGGGVEDMDDDIPF